MPVTFLREPDGRWQAIVGKKALRSDEVLGLAVYHTMEEVGKLDLINASELIAEKLLAQSDAALGRIETSVEEMENLARH